ncbi:uroporphyrinogen-III C-methyltransferase [Paraburkholderia dinghuensis]|uniref:uroporphyrinogen-III C-methyltransferase n=1 Tax=Paraburkholderia dinghuensis TaxID=2305225 RepID=A0A3N6Q7X2_9BURK|nr:uroporphyrinogen-III C-methyltransferase [Paraburkholderia dinghuensis]RQH08636.1 uroporphyrinogen-III C-methyltransferase [Paraburkholderia dinghuensis]
MGKVYLIGAGPGAADLITVRGARLLGTADVVLHDALVEQAMLDYAPKHAKVVAVGKRCGQRSTAQHFINKQLVDAAREHGVVVRLKGGDPMLFGRADEEMRALEAAGIEYEIVPGITAALASAATLRRPLTVRGVARSVALATHSRAADTADIREQVNADSLVFYMGRDSGPDIARELIEAGRTGTTPVAIVEACSTQRERTLTLTLAALAAGEAQDWLDATQPSLLMIGDAFAARAGQFNDEDLMTRQAQGQRAAA